MVLARCCSNTNLRLSGSVDTSIPLSFSVLSFSRTVSVDCSVSLSLGFTCGVGLTRGVKPSPSLRSSVDVGLTRCQQTDCLH